MEASYITKLRRSGQYLPLPWLKPQRFLRLFCTAIFIAMEQETQKLKTRARVIELLRHGRKTVDDLAAALGLTDNAVRMHLAGLEREGLVRAEGVRRSG